MSGTRAFETLATTAASALFAFLLFGLFDPSWVAIVAAASAGINGLFGGLRQVYAWRSVAGWYAFVVDATWGLIGTTIGNAVNIANLFWKGAGYRADLSHRRNRHVFENGFRVGKRYANTQGSVISNARVGQSERRAQFLDRHEDLHVWQNRWFGPVYQILYVSWLIGGFIVGTVAFLAQKSEPKQPIRRFWSTCGYYNCPFEYWAYKNDDHWEDNHTPLPGLRWG